MIDPGKLIPAVCAVCGSAASIEPLMGCICCPNGHTVIGTRHLEAMDKNKLILLWNTEQRIIANSPIIRAPFAGRKSDADPT
jgi:hypothetical protein